MTTGGEALELRWLGFVAEVTLALASPGGGPADVLTLPAAMVGAGHAVRVREVGAALVELTQRRGQLLELSSTWPLRPTHVQFVTAVDALARAGIELGEVLTSLRARWGAAAGEPSLRAGRARGRRHAPVPRAAAPAVIEAAMTTAPEQPVPPDLPAPRATAAAAPSRATAALPAAEAPRRRRGASDEDLLARLRDVAAHGAVPKSFAISLWRRFGSMAAAYAAAGIVPPTRQPITDAQLLAQLREHAPAGRLPTALTAALLKRFGSTAAAYAAAGIPPPTRRKLSNDALLTQLRAHPAGTPMSAALMCALGRRFGSVPAARVAAGLPPLGRKRGARDELLAQLRAVPPTRALPKSLCAKLRTMFGSMAAAYAAARMPPRRPGSKRRRA